jgi:hypothetical protein
MVKPLSEMKRNRAFVKKNKNDRNTNLQDRNPNRHAGFRAYQSSYQEHR